MSKTSLTQETNLIYDPPSGWKYGFPMKYKPLKGEKIWQTLLRDGYPLEEIQKGMDKHCRFIARGEGPYGDAFSLIPEGTFEDELEHVRNTVKFLND